MCVDVSEDCMSTNYLILIKDCLIVYVEIEREKERGEREGGREGERDFGDLNEIHIRCCRSL